MAVSDTFIKTSNTTLVATRVLVVCHTGLPAEEGIHCYSGTPAEHGAGLLEDGLGAAGGSRGHAH